ncbi:MAG: discoidin domain-containing protein [Planctomycetota bacterium]|jgi:galactosylceramidase
MSAKKPSQILGLIVSLTLVLICSCATLTEATKTNDAVQTVNIDDGSEGRVFEGIGALSAGASSRLLIDYPPVYRNQILDYLFKPNYGASFHHLKVEIGGNINSTDGTEPSHAYTKGEFENPRPEYYDRGYEWWLMKEAKKRNPDIYLDCLQWGAPGWIGPEWMGTERFYSQDNADFIAAFVEGAKKHHDLAIDYCGIWNERMYDIPWIKTLRKTLDSNNLKDVKIIAADMHWDIWKIADDMSTDQQLYDAVYAVGVHYPYKKTDCHSTEVARGLGKPLWSSEDGPWRGNWYGAGILAKIYNKNYINGKMTKTIIWSLVSSYYENLPLPNSGVMKANTPWSGYYEVQPALWATAHTTQFAKPGWIYIDSGCGYLTGKGSFVTLKKPDGGGHYSVIIETIDALQSQTVTFSLAGGLSTSTVHVWRTNQDTHFLQLGEITPTNSSFTITLDPGSIYSLTTTTSQKKGTASPPEPADFPFRYTDDFESYNVGRTPKYFSDQSGTFEVAERSDGNGKALRQLITQKGIEWAANPYPETFTGNTAWTDYEVSSDVYIEDSGFVSIFGRLGNKRSWEAKQPNGYWLRVDHNGHWQLSADSKTLVSGTAAFSADTWHSLKLGFSGIKIVAFIDGIQVATTRDVKYNNGMAGVGSGWNNAQFDNFKVLSYAGQPSETTIEPRFINLAHGRTTRASSQASTKFGPGKANDGDATTRWDSAPGKTVGEWLEIDFGIPITFDTVITREFRGFITKYKIQYWDGAEWKDAYTGGTMKDPSPKVDTFTPVTASKVRRIITSTSGVYNSVGLWELEVYNSKAAR